MRKKTAKKIYKESAGARKGRDSFLKRLGVKGLIMCALMFMVAVAAVYCISPEIAMAAGAFPVVFGTTLAANKNRSEKRDAGPLNQFPVIASDIIYEGAAVGDNGSGYARPLVTGDNFLGFAETKVDNSSGSAGDKDVRVHTHNWTTCTISGAVITDVDRPVYASDDDTFTFVAVGTSYVGRAHRFVASGIMEVEFDAHGVDPFGSNEARETHSDNYTIDALDSGKILFMDTDAKIFTLPATVAGLSVTFVNAGAFGGVLLKVAPNANDKIQGNDITSADNKYIANTKATAQRGDFVTLVADGTDGWWITEMKGTWVRE